MLYLRGIVKGRWDMRPIINETISKIPLLSVEEERSLLTAVQEGIPKEKLLEGMDSDFGGPSAF